MEAIISIVKAFDLKGASVVHHETAEIKPAIRII
jgi:hypothetical protein